MAKGLGYTDERRLSDAEIADVLRDGFQDVDWDGARVLVIIPDATRSGPVGRCFKALHALVGERAARLDALVALGTHQPMPREALLKLLDLTQADLDQRYRNVELYNHEWARDDTFVSLGTIDGDEMAELTQGYLHDPVDVEMNRLVLDYDRVLILGPTFPHEVVGFSGGNKYFFPGIARGGIINFTHWLGALHTNMRIIGTKHTPVRRVIDRAASMIPTDRHCISMVVAGKHDLHGLYVGTPEQAWSDAADLSQHVHIVYKPRAFHTVVAVSPTMYDDLWTAGKCMYKQESVVADGGELIIFAPHVDEVSVTHGREIEEVGYHVRDYFVMQPERFAHVSGCIKAHSTHVKGSGVFEDGVETPRVTVTLATGIPREVCDKINLGYRDPASINIEDYADREDEGVLLVRSAGEYLYRLRES